MHLSPNPNNTTTFTHSEKFSGILVNLFAKSLDSDTKNGFEQMNRALKLRVEGVEKSEEGLAKREKLKATSEK